VWPLLIGGAVQASASTTECMAECIMGTVVSLVFLCVAPRPSRSTASGLGCPRRQGSGTGDELDPPVSREFRPRGNDL
jgi:hypothetical protein